MKARTILKIFARLGHKFHNRAESLVLERSGYAKLFYLYIHHGSTNPSASKMRKKLREAGAIAELKKNVNKMCALNTDIDKTIKDVMRIWFKEMRGDNSEAQKILQDAWLLDKE